MSIDLESDDPEVRRRAVAELARAPGPESEAALLRALGDTDWRVRKEAARVASEIAWDLVPALVDALCQGENVGLRNAALEVLERIGPRAAPALLSALPRAPETARKFVIAALGFAGGAGVDELAELSGDPDTNTAQAALEALAKIGGPRAEEALRGHLRSADPVLRLAALEGLERLEARVEVAELEPLLADRLVRRLALRLLAFSDDVAAVRALFAALEETGASASEAAIALSRLLERGGPAAREVAAAARTMNSATRQTLRSLAETGREPVRRAATWVCLLARDQEVLRTAAELAADDRLPPVALEALRTWGADAALPLVRIAGELSPRGRAAALEMASELGRMSFLTASSRVRLLEALREALSSDEPVVAMTAARGLGVWGEASDVERLVRHAARFGDPVAKEVGRALEELASRHPEAVENALASTPFDGPLGAALLPALASLGGARASDRLQAALNADDSRVRRAAVMALPKLGGERAAELAGFALADEDFDVQSAAVQVLAQLATNHASDAEPLGVSHLRLALRASFDPVVATAARALGAIQDRASSSELRELVRQGRPGVAVAAMESLRAMNDPALEALALGALDQGDEELVKEALRAIADGGSELASVRLTPALEHAAWDVRQLAAQLLADVGGLNALSALRDRLSREPDAIVRAVLEDAIARLGGGPEG